MRRSTLAAFVLGGFVLAVLKGCSDAPRKDVPPPGAAGPPPNPLVTDEPRATPAETSPVPSAARAMIQEYVQGSLDPRATALALERVLTDTKEMPHDAGPGWKTSSRRALTHALTTTPRELRSELRRYQDERSRFDTAHVASDIKANRFTKVIRLADRYPNAGFALSLWNRLAQERSRATRELADTTVLGVVPGDGVRSGGISVGAHGEDALVAKDADGITVWEHRPRAPSSETPLLRVLGTFADQLVVLEQTKAVLAVEAIDFATGNTVARVAVDGLSAPHVAVLGPDVVFAVKGRVVVVDLVRGIVGWERTHAYGLPLSITEDRIVLDASGVSLDQTTGRLVEGAAGRPRRQGAVEVR